MEMQQVVIAGLALAMLCVSQASAAPGLGQPAASTLTVQKSGNGERQTLEFRPTILEQKEGQEPHVCLCRAMLFRILQMTAERRAGGVFKVDDVQAVRTGWPSEAHHEILCELLGMPRNRIKFTADGPRCDRPVVEGAWWEIRFVDGKTLTFWATPQVLSEEFLKLRAAHKRGDKSMANKKSLQAHKERLVTVLSTVPLEELFVVRE